MQKKNKKNKIKERNRRRRRQNDKKNKIEAVDGKRRNQSQAEGAQAEPSSYSQVYQVFPVIFFNKNPNFAQSKRSSNRSLLHQNMTCELMGKPYVVRFVIVKGTLVWSYCALSKVHFRLFESKCLWFLFNSPVRSFVSRLSHTGTSHGLLQPRIRS